MVIIYLGISGDLNQFVVFVIFKWMDVMWRGQANLYHSVKQLSSLTPNTCFHIGLDFDTPKTNVIQNTLLYLPSCFIIDLMAPFKVNLSSPQRRGWRDSCWDILKLVPFITDPIILHSWAHIPANNFPGNPAHSEPFLFYGFHMWICWLQIFFNPVQQLIMIGYYLIALLPYCLITLLPYMIGVC